MVGGGHESYPFGLIAACRLAFNVSSSGSCDVSRVRLRPEPLHRECTSDPRRNTLDLSLAIEALGPGHVRGSSHAAGRLNRPPCANGPPPGIGRRLEAHT